MSVDNYIRMLRRRLPLLIAVPILAAAGALIVSLFLTPTYEAQVAMLVRPSEPLAVTDPSAVALTSDQITATYARLLTEPPILQSVIDELNLKEHPEDLAKHIRVTPEANTTVLDVTVQDPVPARAAHIANQLVSDFINQIKTIQRAEAAGAAGNARTADDLVVVAPALAPPNPVSPKIPLNVLLTFAGGVVVALGITFVLDFLDQSIKDDQDLSERLGMMPLARIGFRPGKNRQEDLVVLAPDIGISEAYRQLRTNLLFSAVDQEAKVLMVTSANPQEGKSRTAANLAVVLAQAGHQVLLVDADLRQPTQNKIFGIVRNQGLSNLMVKDVAPTSLARAVETVPNLSVLPSGPVPPNPSELLGSKRMRSLLDILRAQYDYLVIDTPPINLVTDATVLAAAVDGVILVAEYGRTTFPSLLRARFSLDLVNAHLMGIVVNKVRDSPSGYYEGYGYYGSSKAPPPDDGAVAPTEKALSAAVEVAEN